MYEWSASTVMKRARKRSRSSFECLLLKKERLVVSKAPAVPSRALTLQGTMRLHRQVPLDCIQ